MEEIERSAASVEEAIEVALRDLGISEQEAEIEVVQEPRGGILGIKSQPAVVRVRPAATSDDLEEDLEDQADAAADFIQGLMEVLGLDAEVEIQTVDGVTYIDVWAGSSGEDVGLLIGKRGHTLDALQELVRSHVQGRVGGRCLVLVDVEDYRKRRRSRVLSRTREAARRVQRSGRPEALEPMNAFERKIVHDAVAQMGGLETASEGEEPARHVVIRRASR